MGVGISFVLSGFMFHPLTLISLKSPDFNIHVMVLMRKPQKQKKKASSLHWESRIHFRTYLSPIYWKTKLTGNIFFMVMEREVFTEGDREKWNKWLFLEEGIQLGELSRQQELPPRDIAASSTSSSQTTKQPSLPSWALRNKTAGFLPSCAPVPKAPLSVQRLCLLISPVMGWSENLLAVSLAGTPGQPRATQELCFTRAVTLCLGSQCSLCTYSWKSVWGAPG